MMKDLDRAIGNLFEKNFEKEVTDGLMIIVNKWKEYEDGSHTPSERKEFYQKICRDAIWWLDKANDKAAQSKREAINRIPDFVLDKLMYNIFSPTTCNSEKERAENEYKERVAIHNSLKNSFRSILNRY